MRGRRWIDKGELERVFAELQRSKPEAQLEQREPGRPLPVSLDSTILNVHGVETGAPTNRDARRSVAWAAGPRLDRGEA